jgi:hypothetical protein
MKINSLGIARGLAVGAGAGALGYAGLVAWHRSRYGKVDHAAAPGTDELLDRFIPSPEVRERHHIAIDAPPEVVLQAACDMRLTDSALIRGVFRLRELALGGEPDRRDHPESLFAQMRSIGWVVLAETRGREVVFGAATQPWHANPVFRSINGADFEAFREPGYVKIAWSLRADPVDGNRTIFHTETRVATTDGEARRRFRRYWSYVAPGVELIRLAMLRPLKREAERRARLDREVAESGICW